MRFIMSIIFLFISIVLFAQDFDPSMFPGTWKLELMNAKDLPNVIDLQLEVSEETMILKSPTEEVSCSWAFSPDRKFIYSSNEKSDEEWKILELTDKKLVFLDKDQKMQFVKTVVYKRPKTAEELDPMLLEGIEISSEKQLYGDWKLVKIEKDVLDQDDLGINLRPKGGMHYTFFATDSPASWILNEDKKSLTITAFNGLEEKWVIKHFTGSELLIYTGGKNFTFKRK